MTKWDTICFLSVCAFLISFAIFSFGIEVLILRVLVPKHLIEETAPSIEETIIISSVGLLFLVSSISSYLYSGTKLKIGVE